MKDKRILTERMAYVFTPCEDGIAMSDCRGFETCADDLLELGYGLVKYALNCRQLIEAHNEKRQIELEHEMSGYIKACEDKETENRRRRKSKAKKGYVYMLECGGKYKIGFSKDVERRMKQLDTRPFKLNLVTKSVFFNDAYDREQELHKYFEYKRLDGEWYNLTKLEAECAKEIIRGFGNR